MSTASPPESIVSNPIHPERGVTVLISQAWNLIRNNLKECVQIVLWPALLFGLSSLVFAIPSGLTFLTKTSISQILLSLFCIVLGLVLWFGAIILGTASYCTLSRFFYSVITDEKPLSVQQCKQHTRKNWQQLLLTLFLNSFVLSGCVVLDIFLVIVGILASSAVLTALGRHPDGLLSVIMLILLLIVWSFLLLAVMTVLISMQSLLFSFPFVAIAARRSDDMGWWHSMKQAFQLTFTNLPKLLCFSVAFFLFTCVLSAVLHALPTIWAVLEFFRIGHPHTATFPLHVQAVMQFWTSLVSFVMLPLHCSALTLLWYDCQVRKEGLDLKLWLEQLRRRQMSIGRLREDVS
ncbi:MAG TPA: hypothetical protein V6C99_04335 [Oculatellaceae cyanobacterium]|jgi:hypothetical protein